MTLNTDDEFKTDVVRQKAKCTLCHQGFNFTDEGFHNLGVGFDEKTGKFADLGRWAIDPIGAKCDADIGSFKTPTLRDVAHTAPYMHDGSLATLEKVMDHYDKGGTPNSSLDPDMKPLKLTAQEKADVIAFMKALTGETKKLDELLPKLPPGPDGKSPDPQAALTPPAKVAGRDSSGSREMSRSARATAPFAAGEVRMRPVFLVILLLACFCALFLCCYAPALFQDRQFGFRDAGHYYYPLHARVQKEWNAGRWPLWEPEENGGMPLLGQPHRGRALPGQGRLRRASLQVGGADLHRGSFGRSRSRRCSSSCAPGASVGPARASAALSYTFGAPILFQYCNIIYLVGAAWLPLGLRAVDRWVRLGRRWAILELAIVLGMQVLGGDPQLAFLLGVAGLGYALALDWSRKCAAAKWRASARRPTGWLVAGALP